jgi:hypothetical protein
MVARTENELRPLWFLLLLDKTHPQYPLKAMALIESNLA